MTVQERTVRPLPGLVVLVVLLGALALSVIGLLTVDDWRGAFFLLLLIVLFLMRGLMIVNPNGSRVLVLFGNYVGTVKEAGFYWANPFVARTDVSLRVRNFEGTRLKVNDHDGNPVDIAAIIVWRVVDTAEAVFEVEDYEDYVRVQSEAALRNLATLHPYDAHEPGQTSLRGNTAEVAEQLKGEVQARLAKAGVEVIEARISHLAYAPEIAAAMLRRQQASAVVAARQKIVEGAVGMVEIALTSLAQRNIAHLDDERKATLVSNLMVVLCAEHAVQPVVNAGSPPPPHRTGGRGGRDDGSRRRESGGEDDTAAHAGAE